MDDLTIAESAGASIISQLPPETLAKYEIWLEGHKTVSEYDCLIAFSDNTAPEYQRSLELSIEVVSAKGDIDVNTNIVVGND